jgi:hypothetical protein
MRTRFAKGLHECSLLSGIQGEGEFTHHPQILWTTPMLAAKFPDDAIVRDDLINHAADAWLFGRYILRTLHPLVNEWRFR